MQVVWNSTWKLIKTEIPTPWWLKFFKLNGWKPMGMPFIDLSCFYRYILKEGRKGTARSFLVFVVPLISLKSAATTMKHLGWALTLQRELGIAVCFSWAQDVFCHCILTSPKSTASSHLPEQHKTHRSQSSFRTSDSLTTSYSKDWKNSLKKNWMFFWERAPRV